MEQQSVLFKGQTRRFATWVLLVFLTVWAAVSYYVYQTTWHAMLERAENEVRKMTVMQQAIRGYVDEELKPLFYQLQHAGHIPSDFYAPQGFSATYVISHVFQRYDAAIRAREALLKNGVRFHVVSDNPLNPANRASADQLQWLQYFRANPSISEQIELVETKGVPTTLTLYRPAPPNTQACLRCHGDPVQAPPGLRKLYGESAGFGESVGWIRAVSVFEVDLKSLWDATLSRTAQLSALLFVALMLLAFAMIWGYRQLMKDRAIILAQKRQLFDLANRDSLTGLFNRHRLQTVLPQKLAALQQGRIHSLAAVLLDIDHFKSFNDRFGHDVGDLVLNQVGKALQSMCAEWSSSVYRLGGEEFLLLIENPPENFCERIRVCHAQLQQTFDGVPEPISYSAGVAFASRDDTPSSLLKKADIALYYVKRNGRNGVACFDNLPPESKADPEH